MQGIAHSFLHRRARRLVIARQVVAALFQKTAKGIRAHMCSTYATSGFAIQIHGEDPPALPPSSLEGQRWTTLTPPETGSSRRNRGRLARRRSQPSGERGPSATITFVQQGRSRESRFWHLAQGAGRRPRGRAPRSQPMHQKHVAFLLQNRALRAGFDLTQVLGVVTDGTLSREQSA